MFPTSPLRMYVPWYNVASIKDQVYFSDIVQHLTVKWLYWSGFIKMTLFFVVAFWSPYELMPHYELRLVTVPNNAITAGYL